jgi:hypothetical protein
VVDGSERLRGPRNNCCIKAEEKTTQRPDRRRLRQIFVHCFDLTSPLAASIFLSLNRTVFISNGFVCTVTPSF